MKAIILAAGLGTRLRPWTLSHPKALVPVGDVPMLKRVIDKLAAQGFERIVVNIHHFPQQMRDYIEDTYFDTEILISDESEKLLDTGGGVLKGTTIAGLSGDESILVHNVDILSDADLKGLMKFHEDNHNDITLLVSDRDSGRKLLFDDNNMLKGWINKKSGELLPVGIEISEKWKERAFSGIYVIGRRALSCLADYTEEESFPIMEFFLNTLSCLKTGCLDSENLNLIDIGKPATLSQANEILFDK